MDARLIQLLQYLQQSQPVRFDDGGDVDYDFGNIDFGDVDFGGVDFDNLFGEDIQDFSETINLDDLLNDPSLLEGGNDIELPEEGGAGDFDFSQLPPEALYGYGEGPSDSLTSEGDKALSEMEVPQYDETLNPQEDIWRTIMQEGSLDSEGKFNAARDSEMANKYLEHVMGVPRSEIDAAYASAMPRFVNLSNFQGGKSFETGVDRYGNPIGTPGREVKYDSKGNIVDAKTGTVIEKAPVGTTSKQISDILKQYTGGGTGGTGTKSSSNMSWLLPLLMMMLAMNRNQGQSSQAVIPKLSAERTALPYQQAPGYRPGQGGVRYVSDVNYKPMAKGGIASLEGRLLHGPGDGVSDSIPATIGGQQPARLARGEYVIDARTVAELGNGSTDAGAERLDEMRRRVLQSRKTAKIGQNSKAYRHLPA